MMLRLCLAIRLDSLTERELERVRTLHDQLHGRIAGTPAYKFPSNSLRSWADLACCVRYLRARKWDIAAAHTMLCASLDWRFEFFGPRCGRDAAASMDVNELREQMASGKMHVSTGNHCLRCFRR